MMGFYYGAYKKMKNQTFNCKNEYRLCNFVDNNP